MLYNLSVEQGVRGGMSTLCEGKAIFQGGGGVWGCGGAKVGGWDDSIVALS